jgi:hypothetical protein
VRTFVVIVAVALIANAVGLLPNGDSVGAQWTASGRMCGYDYAADDNCSDHFKCRDNGGAVEIYLPYGSSSTGNKGWEWSKDVGDRCGSASQPVADSPVLSGPPDPTKVDKQPTHCGSADSARCVEGLTFDEQVKRNPCYDMTNQSPECYQQDGATDGAGITDTP